jgi:hypothetical protein
MGKGTKAAAFVVSSIFVFGAVASAPLKAADTTIVMPMQKSEVGKQALFKESMRKLWADHVIWTRSYIVATLARSKDAPEVEFRLLRNQVEIGAAFTPFYGQEAGTKLSELLTQHILIAGEVVKYAKKPTSAKFLDADKRWHDNAADIAAFLSAANPNWSKDMLQTMFNDHLALTTKQATSRLNKQWAADIAAFDEVYVQAMQMSDDLANGVIKQFPEKI